MSQSSLIKKYSMALTGIVLVGFVFVHMAGNLQVFLGREAINAYAHALQSLPAPLLWGSRLFLLVCVLIHAYTAYLLISENRAARPRPNEIEVTKRSGWSSLRMGLTGSLLLAFIVFHLLHFTIRSVFPEYQNLKTTIGSPDGREIHDVYAMIISGFRIDAISAFYVFCMFLLCRHLSHGVTSMFQTLGLRAERWRPRLDLLASAYGWILFFGFSVIPMAVIAQKYGLINCLDSCGSSCVSLHP